MEVDPAYSLRAHRRGARPLVIALAAALVTGAAAPLPTPAPVAKPTEPAYAPGVVLVGFRPGVDVAGRVAARAAVGVRDHRQLSPLAPDAERWTLPAGTTVAEAIGRLAADPRLRYAEPDWHVERQVSSNDTYYADGSLWGMHGDGVTAGSNPYGSGADEAWARGYTGSRTVAVGVIDEGIQYTHPDLAANIWTNPVEATGATGVDDDRNGYIDDLHGWDFYNRDAGIYDAGADAHGTHVSGTIGGIGGNGNGVAGVNWNVTIVSGKFLGPSGGYISDAVTAVDYLTDLKARHGLDLVATSNSWGGGGFSQALLDAIDRGGDQGILFVAAAGNSSSNNDATGSYPSNYACTNAGRRDWDCVVAVAAIASNGSLASFSSYGAATVDLGAPGVSVISSVPTDAYSSYSGTSMATPHVSGAVALCASVNASLPAKDLRAALLASTSATASLAGKTVTGGRLDVGRLVDLCAPLSDPVSGSPSGLAATTVDYTSVDLAWTDGVAFETYYEVQRASGTAGACGTFATVATLGADSSSFRVSGLDAAAAYCFRVRGASGYGGGSYSAWSNESSGRTADPPPPYTCAVTTYSWVTPSSSTTLGLTDDSTTVVALPSNFTFTNYGNPVSSVTVSSNGFVRVGSATGSYYVNDVIPSSAEPNGILAPAWDDWNPSAGGTISYGVVGTRPNRSVVVTWQNVPHYSVAGSAVTFQAILEEGADTVRFQYADMLTGSSTHDSGAQATAGVESESGAWGTLISLNSALLTSGKAYRCASGPILAGPTIGSVAYPEGTVGSPYLVKHDASGGTAPYTWSLEGMVPAGLAIAASSGDLAGTPTTAGAYSFTVRVTGADGGSSTRAASLTIAAPLSITTSSLPAGTAGGSYSTTLTATGGTSPYSWSVDPSSPLPPGLTLSSSGTISGTPTVAGAFGAQVIVSDGTRARTATRTLSLAVAFAKRSPSNGSKTAKGLRTPTLAWYAQAGAIGYRYCVATTSGCTSWVATTDTSAATALLTLGTTYYWQAQVQTSVGGSWASANGGTYWRFTTSR